MKQPLQLLKNWKLLSVFNDAVLRHLTIQTKAAVTEASPMMREEKSKSLISEEAASEEAAEA